MRRNLLIIILLISTLLFISGVSAFALDPGAGVKYLKSSQAADSGFAEPDSGSDFRTTCWAVLGIISAGEDPKSMVKEGGSPIDYLNKHGGEVSELEDFELYVLAYSEAGVDPHNISGKDMVSVIKSFQQEDGKIGNAVSQHCLGIIALLAADEEIPSKCSEWIVQNQRSDGGWGESETIRDTSLAVEALTALGEGSSEIIEPAMKFLKEGMNGDGGFSGKSESSDTQTTSYALRAINSVGDDPASEFWTFQGNNPISFMSVAQQADGHFTYFGDVESQPVLTTGMALPAIGNKSFPLGTTRENNGIEKISDFGTLGAGIARSGNGESNWSDKSKDRQGESEVSDESSMGRVKAGYAGENKSQLNNLWFLVITGIIYLTVLAGAGLITRIIVHR